MGISLLALLAVLVLQPPLTLRGQVVCLLDETGAAPGHAHEFAFESREGNLYPLHRSATSEALFADPAIRQRLLEVTGRLREREETLEIIRLRSVRDGVRHEIFYWCETCAIRALAPGPCWCCREPLQLREVPAGPDRP